MGVEDLEDQQELMDEIFRVVDAERNLTDSFATVVKTHRLARELEISAPPPLTKSSAS